MMIDTIAIRIDSVDLKTNERENYKSYKYNPYGSFTINKFYKNVKVGNCTAKLTYVVSYQNNHREYYFDIEISSIPKLLYGNNFQETKNYYTDFQKVVTKIRKILVDNGAIAFSKKLLQSNSSFRKSHFAKNLCISCDTELMLEYLSKGYIPRFDVSRITYRNGGSCTRFHTKSVEIAFYNKVAELSNSIDGQKVITDNQLSGLNILRMEVRYNTKKAIYENNLNLHDTTINGTFSGIFSKELSKKVLVFWWSIIKKSLPKTQKNNFCEFIDNIDETDIHKKLETAGALMLVNNIGKTGAKNFLTQISDKKTADRTADKIIKRALATNLKNFDENIYSKSISEIDMQLEHFEEIQKITKEVNKERNKKSKVANKKKMSEQKLKLVTRLISVLKCRMENNLIKGEEK